jgi:hypothetical protein
MYFSIAWGLNPRLLKMKIGNKLLNVIPLFLGSPYKSFRMTDRETVTEKEKGTLFFEVTSFFCGGFDRLSHRHAFSGTWYSALSRCN